MPLYTLQPTVSVLGACRGEKKSTLYILHSKLSTLHLPSLVYAHPVYPQFRGQLLGIADGPYPFTAELIGEDEIEGIVGPRELIFLLRESRIGQRLFVVDEETYASGLTSTAYVFQSPSFMGAVVL